MVVARQRMCDSLHARAACVSNMCLAIGMSLEEFSWMACLTVASKTLATAVQFDSMTRNPSGVAQYIPTQEALQESLVTLSGGRRCVFRRDSEESSLAI